MSDETPNPVVGRTEFETLVTQALDDLPEFFREKLSNVEVIVTDWPSWSQLKATGITNRNNLLGLYQGIPLTRRTTHYNMVLPDKITIFRMPISQRCRTRQSIVTQVRRTVLHELAHHFGISDDRLRELGAY